MNETPTLRRQSIWNGLLAFVYCFVCVGSLFAQDIQAKPFKGLCYGPYRNAERPGGTYPTETEMRQDLGVLKSLTSRIRIYGNENTLSLIPKLCEETGVECYAAAWIDTDTTANNQQLTNMLRIATNHFAITRGFIVGNEYLLRNEQNAFASAKSNLLAYVRIIKKTGVRVGVADGWHIWNNSFTSDLVSELDFVLVHIHPYWESQYNTPNLSITNALQHVTNKFNLIKAKYPGKQIMIGETGWPSRGTKNYAAVPSDENQKRFLMEFIRWANANNVDYFLFEAYDEPWKGTTIAEGGFGVLNSTHPFAPKPSLIYTLTNGFNLSVQANPVSLIFQSSTFSGNQYTLEQTTGLTPLVWQTVTNFSGTTNSASTTITLPRPSSDPVYYRTRAQF